MTGQLTDQPTDARVHREMALPKNSGHSIPSLQTAVQVRCGNMIKIRDGYVRFREGVTEGV